MIENRFKCCTVSGRILATCPGHNEFGADCEAWNDHVNSTPAVFFGPQN